jgi:urease accessory protein
MPTLPIAQRLIRKGHWSGPADSCTLDYDTRFLRRKRLSTDAGRDFIVDLAQSSSLDDGDALALGDGSLVVIRAAPEDVLIVTGPDLPRLAWHIGNRHTPCQLDTGANRLVIQNDPVIAHMLEHLGASMTPARAPFTPEGGAYGHGRTHAHDHGASAHAH